MGAVCTTIKANAIIKLLWGTMSTKIKANANNQTIAFQIFQNKTHKCVDVEICAHILRKKMQESISNNPKHALNTNQRSQVQYSLLLCMTLCLQRLRLSDQGQSLSRFPSVASEMRSSILCHIFANFRFSVDAHKENKFMFSLCCLF